MTWKILLRKVGNVLIKSLETPSRRVIVNDRFTHKLTPVYRIKVTCQTFPLLASARERTWWRKEYSWALFGFLVNQMKGLVVKDTLSNYTIIKSSSTRLNIQLSSIFRNRNSRHTDSDRGLSWLSCLIGSWPSWF